jgi:alpha-mannosidase
MPAPQVFIVPAFHHDVAYLKRYDEYQQEVLAIVDRAVELLRENPAYRFNIEQSICLEDWWRERPDGRGQMRELYRQGRLTAAPGMYVVPDMNLPAGEALYMQCLLGRRWIREHLGEPPRTCWVADGWGHPPQLPQILRQCGYRRYVFWRAMRPQVRRSYFRWRGLDGTTIDAFWNARSYSMLRFGEGDVLHAEEQHFAEARAEAIRRLLDALEEIGGREPAILINSGDFLPPQQEALKAAETLDADPSLPPVTIETIERALDAVDFEATEEVAGEFNGLFSGTWTTNIDIKQRDRELTWRMLGVEALAVRAGQPLGDPASTWRLILKQQFHDTICGTLCDGAVEDARREQQLVAERIETHLAEALPAGDDAQPQAINPSAFNRRELIEREDGPAEVSLTPLSAAPLAEARPLALHAEPRALPAVFENEFFRAVVGEDGYLTSLRRAGSEIELIAPRPAAFGSLAMQLDFGDPWLNFTAPLGGDLEAVTLARTDRDGYRREQAGRSHFTGTIAPSGLVARVLRSGEGLLEVEQTGRIRYWRVEVPFRTVLRLRAGSGRIDYTTALHTTGKNVRVRAAFPTTLAGGRIRHEVHFGLADRSEGEAAVQNLIDLAGPDGALAVLNAGIPAGNVCDGVMMLTLLRSVAMEYKTDSQLSYQLGREHTFQYAVFPHDTGPGGYAAAVREGAALNQPLLVRRAATRRAETAPEPPWQIEPANVILSALRHEPAAGAGAVFCRLYEAVGEACEARLLVPPRFQRFAPADGMQEPAGPWQPLDGPLTFALRPFEIRNLLLSP